MTALNEQNIQNALNHFERLLRSQMERAERLKNEKDFVDYASLDQIIIGVCGGDGIGPTITKESARVLRYLLKQQVDSGKVVFRDIDGLTIERPRRRWERRSRMTCWRS